MIPTDSGHLTYILHACPVLTHPHCTVFPVLSLLYFGGWLFRCSHSSISILISIKRKGHRREGVNGTNEAHRNERDRDQNFNIQFSFLSAKAQT